MKGNFNLQEYLNKFNTKEEIENELARLQRNMDNLPIWNFRFFHILARKKIPLLKKYDIVSNEYLNEMYKLHKAKYCHNKI